jgi:hypothetical protein
VAVAAAEEVVAVRCPSCGGLRGVSARHAARNGGNCWDCKKGRVVRREDFYAFWLERFSPDEIREMAQAIWGGVATTG